MKDRSTCHNSSKEHATHGSIHKGEARARPWAFSQAVCFERMRTLCSEAAWCLTGNGWHGLETEAREDGELMGMTMPSIPLCCGMFLFIYSTVQHSGYRYGIKEMNIHGEGKSVRHIEGVRAEATGVGKLEHIGAARQTGDSASSAGLIYSGLFGKFWQNHILHHQGSSGRGARIMHSCDAQKEVEQNGTSCLDVLSAFASSPAFFVDIQT
jgi:hypothetical protein